MAIARRSAAVWVCSVVRVLPGAELRRTDGSVVDVQSSGGWAEVIRIVVDGPFDQPPRIGGAHPRKVVELDPILPDGEVAIVAGRALHVGFQVPPAAHRDVQAGEWAAIL